MNVFIFLSLLFPCLVFAVDSTENLKWYLQPDGQAIRLDIDDLHSETLIASKELDWGYQAVQNNPSKRAISIAVMDGGLDLGHPDLASFIQYSATDCLSGSIIPPKDEGVDGDQNGFVGDCAGWDFVNNTNRPDDEDGHGTHVAGIIASILKNHSQFIKILPLKVLAPGENMSSSGDIPPLNTRLEKAFEYALLKKVDVIHLSVGWPKDVMSRKLADVIQRVLDSGIAIIAAAGNSAQLSAPWPCRIEGVICVGALRPDGSVAKFSNRGAQIDFFAPGEKILSSIPMSVPSLYYSKKGYDYKSGTSQAAPILSASFAFLLSLDATATAKQIYEKLLFSASPAPQGQGVRGVFHLDKVLANEKSQIRKANAVLIMKNLSKVSVSLTNEFILKFKIENKASAQTLNVTQNVSCEGAGLSNPKQQFNIAAGESTEVSVVGQLQDLKNKYLNCDIKLDNQKYEFQSKILFPLPKPDLVEVIAQTTPIVLQKISGAISRLITVPAVNDLNPQAIYYVAGAKDFSIFYKNKFLGSIPQDEECKRLRIWQVDLNFNGQNDFIKESICDKKHLVYDFYDENLNKIYEGVIYRPELSTINYDKFEVVAQNNQPPILRYINNGFIPKPDSPWEDSKKSFDRHFYTLTPELQAGVWSYKAKIDENIKKWAKDLGLRYTPQYQLLHQIGDSLLIKIEGKTVWVDISTQTANYAGLDHLLWDGAGQQRVQGSSEAVIHLFVTPYEYRGHILGGVSLRFNQKDRHDPLMQAMSMIKTKNGYRLVLRTFAYLWFVDYDYKGNAISQEKVSVDRFDFIGIKDQMSSISQASFRGTSLLVVDGTRISTNYLDVLVNGESRTWELPDNCASQAPVEKDDKLYLPVVCTQSKEEFQLNWIPIGE